MKLYKFFFFFSFFVLSCVDIENKKLPNKVKKNNNSEKKNGDSQVCFPSSSKASSFTDFEIEKESSLALDELDPIEKINLENGEIKFEEVNEEIPNQKHTCNYKVFVNGNYQDIDLLFFDDFDKKRMHLVIKHNNKIFFIYDCNKIIFCKDLSRSDISFYYGILSCADDERKVLDFESFKNQLDRTRSFCLKKNNPNNKYIKFVCSKIINLNEIKDGGNQGVSFRINGMQDWGILYLDKFIEEFSKLGEGIDEDTSFTKSNLMNLIKESCLKIENVIPRDLLNAVNKKYMEIILLNKSKKPVNPPLNNEESQIKLLFNKKSEAFKDPLEENILNLQERS